MSRLRGWASIALGIADRTPLRNAVAGRLLAPIIEAMTARGFRPVRVIHPENDPPILMLEAITRTASRSLREAGPMDALRSLLRKGEPYEAEVPLKHVVGVSASKGRKCMRLDSLPETMFRLPGEGFGPFDEAGMERLRAAVMAEFSPKSREGLFHLDLQLWDGAYIAGNHGASRRFALWRRLADGRESIRAEVTPHGLDAEAVHALRDRWRVVCVRNDGGLLGPLIDAEQVLPGAFGTLPSMTFGERSLWFAAPYPHAAPRGCEGPIRRMHLALDDAGVFDLGRYLVEAMAATRQREA